MEMSLTGHHVDISPSLRSYVDNKVERLERHFDHATDIHVILSVEKLRHKAEARMNLPGNELFADAVDENMYAAIDELVDKLDRQVKTFKEKKTNHHPHG
ncbi:MAG TPA: ribosome-associated translation inhibitor RaiA [Gammaproteobacteria bacterium]|nr:ribosome-associated translation inhibitor RaiA [Gammaproteobacteria bacterium]HET8552288.1 ribosome-associated translation inhibitor RaiA [Gammaproteobacteria bacterium]